MPDGAKHKYAAQSAQEAVDLAYNDYGVEPAGATPSASEVARMEAEKMPQAIQLAREETIPTWMKYIMPYQASSIASGENTDDLDLAQDVAQDMLSLPGRFISGSPSVRSEDVQGTGVIPTVKRIVKSPVTGVAALSVPLTAGASIPVAVGANTALALGSGFGLSEDYGGKDAAMDAALSLIPALGPVVKGLSSTAAIKVIGKALLDKGIDPARVPQLTQELWSRMGATTTVKGAGNEMAHEASSSLRSDLTRPVSPGGEVTHGDGIITRSDEELGAIEGTMAAKPPRKRSLPDAKQAMARYKQFQSDVAMLNRQAPSMDDQSYKDAVQYLMEEYADVPEALADLQRQVSATRAINTLGYQFVGGAPGPIIMPEADWATGLSRLQAGKIAQTANIGVQQSDLPLSVQFIPGISKLSDPYALMAGGNVLNIGTRVAPEAIRQEKK